ncbi:MAG: FtsW/RodA/SpoVE family cell cycle protein [Firmicutes bacterium]|nr:FtsW/RodA/SpoVE family cell cycle protein [Bacillota bacterium]
MFDLILNPIMHFFTEHPDIGQWYTTFVRWVFPLLALVLLIKVIRSLLQAENPAEVWATLRFPNGTEVPLTHWENVIGRAKSADIVVPLASVSRSHGTLTRTEDGVWYYHDLGSKSGTLINGKPVTERTPISFVDTLTIGGAEFKLMPVPAKERRQREKRRFFFSRPESPWSSLLLLTIFQFLAGIQFMAAYGNECPVMAPVCLFFLSVVMWAYYFGMRALRRVAFEMETIAFFLSTLGFCVCATASQGDILKQFVALCLGVVLFLVISWFLQDLDRCKKVRMPLVVLGVIALALNLVLGTITYGARNWISIGGVSVQPSELVKLAFVFAGAATLDELYEKGNLTLYVIFSGICFAALGIMGDFGTALIFFVTFLVISFLRSGDFSKLILILMGAAAAGMMILRFKPYIANRFAAWGHVWEYASTTGYQQTRTMSAAASGGLVGVGGGEGWLHDVAASETDLVFGVLSEEWGLLIAVLAVLCILTLAVFAVKSISSGRSTFYTIAACAGTTILVMQTILNVFGSVDILPLTGVTFPFVSCGGTSMIVSWGILAFLKAVDTRQNASFAVRLTSKKEKGGGSYEEA